jgi:hypothetical protein
LGKATVALRTEIADITSGRVVRASQARFDENPFADTGRIDALAGGDNCPADIGTLDAGQIERRSGPAGVAGFGGIEAAGAAFRRGALNNRFGIPARAGVDVGVVDRRRADADQHVAAGRLRDRHILAVVERVQSAMPGEQDRRHLFRDRHEALIGSAPRPGSACRGRQNRNGAAI